MISKTVLFSASKLKVLANEVEILERMLKEGSMDLSSFALASLEKQQVTKILEGFVLNRMKLIRDMLSEPQKKGEWDE